MLNLILATVLLPAAHRASPPPRAAFAPPARVAAAASPAPARFADLGYPADLTKARLQALLQDFVDAGSGRRFRRLGDERDFDHGHILTDPRTGKPAAILYHTQELAQESPEGLLDPAGRNWLQWLDGRGIENARAYERAAYPRSGLWDWFVARDLPKLKARGTILDKMLDPRRLGFEPAGSRQWTFTRVACGADAADPASTVVRVSLPGGTPACLALGAPL